MWIDGIVGKAEEKRRWRAAKERLDALPAPYEETAEAIERYLLRQGAIDADRWTAVFEDLADLFERAAVDGVSVRELIGEDPTGFIEAFADNYGPGPGRTRAHRELLDAVDRATGRGGPSDPVHPRTSTTGSRGSGHRSS